jgi:hypothetical protein
MNRCPFGQGFDFTDPDVLLEGMPVSKFAETAPVGAGLVERAADRHHGVRRRRLLGDHSP